MLLLVIRFWVKLIDFAICGHSLLRLYFILVASVIMSRLPKIIQSKTNIRLAVCSNIQNPCTVLLILHNICPKYRTALTEGPYQEPPWRSSTFTLQQYRLLV